MIQNIGDLCGFDLERITVPYMSRCYTLVAHMLKESTLNNKRHYIPLRCVSWYKQWAWREPQHTGFCVTVHVRSRLLLYAAVSRSGYPGADRIQDGGERGGGEGGGGGEAVCERTPGTSRVMKVREKGKNTAGARMPAVSYRPHVLFPRLLATRVTIDSCCIAIVAWR